MTENKIIIPIWKKSNLTVEEAAAYCGIGSRKLREMSDSEFCPFVLWNGSKRLIKRRKLDEYLDNAYTVKLGLCFQKMVMNDEKNRSGLSERYPCAHHGANADAKIGRLPCCDFRVAGRNRRVVQNASTGCAFNGGQGVFVLDVQRKNGNP